MRPAKETGVLSVATVREPRKDGAIVCLFNEREQVFTLPSSARARDALIGPLKEALAADTPLRVVLNPRQGVVQRVTTPSARELREFEETRIVLENPDRPRKIDVARIDPTTFNIVEHHLKWPTFALCNKTIPSYKVAKDIFDFCAAQSCHLPGPPAISHCIPFQYVRDGCFARAHKMRQIIEDKYGFCCEKVFSFANLDWDELAVKANKWGGCCVTWWYHVAPLVRVRLRFKLGVARFEFVVAMVIDPGMFDKPVLLSSWLTAQKDTTCSAFANVAMYSIQPGSAYWPLNLAGTSFGTDPALTSTHFYLNLYKNLTTCP